MASPSKTFTVVLDSAVDADSPVTADLMENLRDNTIHNRECIYDPDVHTAALAHDHDGKNSSKVAGSSGGVQLAVTHPILEDASAHIIHGQQINFKPQALLTFQCAGQGGGSAFLGADGRSFVRFLTAFGITTTYWSPYFYVGGVGLDPQAASTDYGLPNYRRTNVYFKDRSDFIKVGTYTGTGAALNVTVGFEADYIIVWSNDNGRAPVIRSKNHSGVNSRALNGSNITDGITAILTTEFSLGTNALVNTNSEDYNFLALKEGTFDGETIEIVHYEGDGAAALDVTGTKTEPAHAAMVVCTDTTATQYPVYSSIPMQPWSRLTSSTSDVSNGIISINTNGLTVGANASCNTNGTVYDALLLRGGVLTSE